MQRRQFLTSAAVGTLATAIPARAAAPTDHGYFTALARRIAEPVLGAMSRGRLHRDFPLELSPTWDGRDPKVAYLECFGRLIAGVAPWLALPENAALCTQALQGLEHSVDPGSPDFLLWDPASPQALVDSAFYTNALIRAPKALWEPLSATTRARIVAAIKRLRAVDPPYTNWLLFAAMNEAFLMSVGEEFDSLRIGVAVRKFGEWYGGDGWYSDGERFAFDYYNSYVIHPMLLEILELLARHKGPFWKGDPADLFTRELKRSQRYAAQLERMISPTGTYPPIGRSLTYRTAAFQPLAQLAWRKQLPEAVPEGQARAAMAAVHRAIFAAPGNFTADGFLTIGFAGHQPGLADVYSNNGSMYLAAASLLPLGLPATDSYWTAAPLPWTQQRAFTNQPFARDHSVDY